MQSLQFDTLGFDHVKGEDGHKYLYYKDDRYWRVAYKVKDV